MIVILAETWYLMVRQDEIITEPEMDSPYVWRRC